MDEYKKVLKEIINSEIVPNVWAAGMYHAAKEYLSEDEEGYKTFQGKRIYFVNEKDGSLINWKDIK